MESVAGKGRRIVKIEETRKESNASGNYDERRRLIGRVFKGQLSRKALMGDRFHKSF